MYILDGKWIANGTCVHMDVVGIVYVCIHLIASDCKCICTEWDLCIYVYNGSQVALDCK